MDSDRRGVLSETVLDEIALEGLDGITLEALWKRLSVALKFSLPLKESFQKLIWTFIIKSYPTLKFYELPIPRENLRDYQPAEPFDDVSERENDDDQSSYIIYKWNIIEKDGVRGSCEFYNDRKEISLDELKDLSINDIEQRWNNKFVIVADQVLREKSLFPSYLMKPELSAMLYCFLEYIGRGRRNGVVASGKFSLHTQIKDSALIFYLKNILLDRKLIKRQEIRSTVKGRSILLNVLHLSRFFSEIKSRNFYFFRMIYDILKYQPNYAMPSPEIRKLIPSEYQKMFKRTVLTDHFKKYFYYEKMPYRRIYPNAPVHEWKLKNNIEKVVIGIQLVNSNFDFEDIKDNKDEEIIGKDDDQGYLDMRNRYIDMPIYDQIFRAIEQYGAEGCTQQNLGKYLGMNRYEIRKYLKEIIKSKAIVKYMRERGKQRIWLYMTSLHAKTNEENVFNPSAGDLYETLKNNTKVETRIEKIKAELQKQIDSENINENNQEYNENLNENSKSENEIAVEQIPSSSSHSKIIEKLEKNVACLDVINSTKSTKIKNNDSKQFVVINVENNDKINNLPSMNIRILQIMRNLKIDLKSPVTQRQIRRTNLVVNTVNEYQMIDIIKMYRIIKDYEKDMGYKDKCCKKSLIRLVNCLAQKKIIKVFDVIYQLKEYARSGKYLCHNNITANSLLENDDVKRLGNSFYITVAEKYFDTKVVEGIKIENGKKERYLQQCSTSMIYKKCARFKRARHLHELLFYLIHEQNKSSKPIKLNDDIFNNWSKYYQNLNLTEIKNIIPDLYSDNIDFKMFIMPLPVYKEKCNGWAYMDHVWQRLPLSIAAQMFRIEVNKGNRTELNKYLTHPILQFIPISLLPVNVLGSSKLLNAQSYDDIIKILNIMGLIQIGQNKEILETNIEWIYLNRHASLLDTSTSDEGYNMISSDKEYEVIRFTFDTDNDIQSYWNTLYHISLVTKLGLRKTNNNTKIRNKREYIKKDRVEIPDMQTIGFDDALKNDNGELPGNRLGVGGLDTSLHVHLPTNWNSMKCVEKQVIQQKNNKIPLRLNSVIYKVTTRDRKVATIKSKSLSKLDPLLSKRKTKFCGRGLKKCLQNSLKRNKSNIKSGNSITIKSKKEKSDDYDEIDLQALKKMQSIRAKWSDEEDEILLCCRSILTYWQHPLLYRIINAFTIRDILHWSSKISLNKTSVACRRRLTNLKKFQKCKSNLSSWVFELKQSKFINQRFGKNFLSDLRKVYTDDLEYGNALRIYFIQMFYYLRRILKNGSILGESQCILIPSTLNQFWKFYKETQPAIKSAQIIYFDPKTNDDIEISTINLIIHSSMCCTKDKTLYNVQLFDIYKMYKEDILLKALTEAKDTQLAVQFKKRSLSQTCTSIFGLSHRYKLQLLNISIPYNSYDEFYRYIIDTYDKLYEKKIPIEFSSINSGGIFYLSNLLNNTEDYELDIQIPQKILTIDPQQSCSGESEKILDHFRKIFENAKKVDYSKILQNTIVPDDGIKDNTMNITTNESNTNPIQSQTIRNKTKFNFIHDTYSLMYNPYDILIKLHDSYLHFYCGLINLNKVCNINYQIIKNVQSLSSSSNDDHKNLIIDNCPFNNNCILENKNYLNKIDEIIQDNKETINVLARNNDNESDDNGYNDKKIQSNEQKILLTTENLLSIFSKYHNIYKSEFKIYDKKDLGKIEQNKTAIDMIKLTKDLLEYQLNNQDNDDDENENDDVVKMDDLNNKSSGNETATLNKEEKFAKMQDLFVVNIPKLRITYKDNDDIVNYGKLKIPKQLHELCKKFDKILEKVKSDCMWSSPNISLDDFEKDFKKNSEFSDNEKQFTKNLLEFIKDCPLGATSTMLREKFIDEHMLTKCMNILRKYNFVMRVGVGQWTFVHNDHIRPWVAYSYHIKRLERESIEPKSSNVNLKIAELIGCRKRKKVTENDEIEPKGKKLKLQETLNDENTDITLNTSEDLEVHTSSAEDDIINEIQEPSTSSMCNDNNFVERKRRIIKPREEWGIYESNNQIIPTNRETIILRPFPWIRVNGSLNRRVFDKWLGTILLQCLSMHGLMIKKLFIRFNYLHPVCIEYLLEVLQELECVALKKFEKKKFTLFSSYEENEETDATEFSNLDHVFVTVKPNAINNLALFIGEKKYKSDFV